jgi:hypothetical protein
MKCENCETEMQKIDTKYVDSHNIIVFYKCPKCSFENNRMKNILDGDQ